jgi:hypothetical protein
MREALVREAVQAGVLSIEVALTLARAAMPPYPGDPSQRRADPES